MKFIIFAIRDMSFTGQLDKIVGDFGEYFVMYWLSKRNFEPIYVDYIGIDVIAWNKEVNMRLYIC